ncbi:hypothetical protein A2U01_0064887, partial [Trifolium medium]|nr:hypothetical protein [Trifolium medium]
FVTINIDMVILANFIRICGLGQRGKERGRCNGGEVMRGRR